VCGSTTNEKGEVLESTRAHSATLSCHPPLHSLNHQSKNPEELLLSSGVRTHHIEGTCETGLLLRHFLCAVVILKHIPECSFRKHVILFFSSWWKENYVDPEGWFCLTSSLITWVTGCNAPSLH